MSISYLAMALKTKLPTAQKLVLLCLAEACDNWGYITPGQKYIAQKTGLSKRSVIRAINEMVELGLVVPHRHPGLPTVYQLRGSEEGIPAITKDGKLETPEVNLSSEESDLSSSDKLALVTNWHYPSPPSSPPNGFPSDSLSLTPPISPPTQSTNARARGKTEYSEEFENFWKLYPRGIGKIQAYAEWQKINPSPELQEEILAHVKERAKKDPEWLKEGGKYVVYAERFLKHRRWQDHWKLSSASDGGDRDRIQYHHPGELRPWEK